MACYFPDHARGSRYEQLYAELSAVERVMLLREFIGVTYRRRFWFFRQYDYRAFYRAPLRHNLQVAAARQDQRLQVPWRIWRKSDLRPHYLRLVLRHYQLGALLQRLRRRHRDRLPPAEPGCHPDGPMLLTALGWYLNHAALLTCQTDQLIARLEAENCRSLYLYCLACQHQISQLLAQDDSPLEDCLPLAQRVGGRWPLGAELEFSNLGYRASFEHSFGRHRRDPRFHNFIYFHHYFLEDVSWRLGGYLDHHVRLRRYLPLPWIGGFFEYSLVRMDYLRRYSLPLTCDPMLLAHYIARVVRFSPDIAPHSLHLNCEQIACGERLPPRLGDLLCLLLLGGDLQRDDSTGDWVEQRLSRHELIKLVRRRQHLSLWDGRPHAVVEYAFCRLRAHWQVEDWFLLLLAVKGFNASADFGHGEQVPIELLAQWARRARPLAAHQIEGFVTRVAEGLLREQVYSAAQVSRWRVALEQRLWRENRRLAGE